MLFRPKMGAGINLPNNCESFDYSISIWQIIMFWTFKLICQSLVWNEIINVHLPDLRILWVFICGELFNKKIWRNCHSNDSGNALRICYQLSLFCFFWVTWAACIFMLFYYKYLQLNRWRIKSYLMYYIIEKTSHNSSWIHLQKDF